MFRDGMRWRDCVAAQSITVATLWCLGTLAHADLPPVWFDQMVVLGDSVSDTGNVWELSNRRAPVSPPYFEGRYSNGPVWVEYLSEHLGVTNPGPSLRGGTNYAYGGAQVGHGETLTGDGVLVPTIGAQVEAYLSSNAPKENDLFVIKAGYNNFGFAKQTDHQAVADDLDQHVRKLYAEGARSFLLSGLYNGGEGEVRDAFNADWRQAVRRLDDELDATVVYFDWASAAAQFWSRAADYGVTNLNTGKSALDPATLEVAENPNSFVCWDLPACHQPTNVHQYFGEYAYESTSLADEVGDFNRNGKLDADDVDRLNDRVRQGRYSARYDMNNDGLLSDLDLRTWVRRGASTYFGDANLDGKFNNGDLVSVLVAGEYEDGIAGNSGWTDGDWDGDGEFSRLDLVLALQDGDYGAEPLAALSTVPEPASVVLLIVGLWFVALARFRVHSRD